MLKIITQNLHHLSHPVEHDPFELLHDVLDEDLLLPYVKLSDICAADHCEHHYDLDKWIIPLSWDIENTIYRSPSRISEV